MQEQVGRYRILNQLGRGAMGVVYLAEDPVLNRKVAIKMVDVSVDDAGEKEFLGSRLLRDARAAAALSHPNIVTVHDVLEEGGKAYVVMEYIDGETLAARLKKSPIPDSAFALRVLREMAAALDYTHARGIIHRDIKPANVMIDAAGTTKIMDFGIARIHDAPGTTATGLVMGTIEYMSPEQVKGETLDGHADQFSLAAVAYQMVSGSTLFGQHSFTTLAYKIVNEQPPLARTHNAALPPAIDATLSKALSKVPSERFGNCAEFVDALAAAFAGRVPESEEATRVVPVVTAPKVVPPPAPLVIAPKRKFPIGIAAVLGILILIGAAWFLWRRPAAQPADNASATSKPLPAQTAASAPASTPPPVTAPEKADTVKTTQPPRRPAESTVTAKREPEEEPKPDTEEPVPPGPAAELYDKAQALIKAKQDASAIEALDKAIAIRHDFPKAYLSRGMAHLRLNQLDAAIDDYSTVIRLRPKNALAFYERGVCHSRQNRPELALPDYDQALQLKPDMPLALNARGLLHFRHQRYKKALADFNEAIRVAPNLAPAYLNRAKAREATGDMAGARADMKKAEQLNANRPSA